MPAASEASISEAILNSVEPVPKAVRVRIGMDSVGEPAVWVTLVLADEDLERIWDQREDVRSRVEDTVRTLTQESHWPFVGFQAESEQTDEVER